MLFLIFLYFFYLIPLTILALAFLSKKFKHMEQAQKYFDQQFKLRRQTKAEMDKYTTNEEEVSALSQLNFSLFFLSDSANNPCSCLSSFFISSRIFSNFCLVFSSSAYITSLSATFSFKCSLLESRKMLRLLEVKLEKAVEKWRDGRRLIYKFRKRLSEIDEELIDARIAIKMFKISKKFKHMEQAQKYFDQQFELRRQTKAEMDKYTTNEEEVSALSQQFTDRHNEHLKEKVALKEVIYAEEENTRQKLENMREDIKKEERQDDDHLATFPLLFPT
jgi:hypothetical protein